MSSMTSTRLGNAEASADLSLRHSFEELTDALFIGGGLKTALPRQKWNNVQLQVSPTMAAASVVVLLIVTSLFLIAEHLRPQVWR